MKKLISMTDFVLDRYDKVFYGRANGKNAENYISQTMKYANFLKQPLKISMFVPCDEEGNILIDPAKDDFSFYTHVNLSVQEEYQIAKEKVLFEGFSVTEHSAGCTTVSNKEGYTVSFSDKPSTVTIDNLTSFTMFPIFLSEQCIKQIYGNG